MGVPIYKGHRESVSPEAKAGIWNALREEIAQSECQTIVLSSEEFDNLTASEIAQLKVELSDYDLKILVFLRRFDDLVDSIYRTSVLVHHVRQDSSVPESYVRVRLDISASLAQWAAISSEGQNLHVYDFDALNGIEAIYGTFFNDIGIDYSTLSIVEERLNESLSSLVTEWVRQLHLSGASQEAVDSLLPMLLEMDRLSGARPKSSSLSNALREALLASYKSEIVSLKAAGLIDADAFKIADMQVVPANEINTLESALASFAKPLHAKLLSLA